MQNADKKLELDLVLDELFDLLLYQALIPVASSSLKPMLQELIVVERKHHAFWEDFFQIQQKTLNPLRRLKLTLIVLACRLFGDTSIHLVLEAIEIYGIRKYLTIWNVYKDKPLAKAIENILKDEFEHEDQIVSGYTSRKINPEKIRNIFLGFNDGLVELMGAISGFFAAFQNVSSVFVAALTTGVAGALSMAIGASAAMSSENEIKRTESEKERFLQKSNETPNEGESPSKAGILVGISYLVGAFVPILPIGLGAKSALISWVCGGILLVAVSLILSFISGMNIRKRILRNVIAVAIAVIITHAIGLLVKKIFGIETV